MISRRRVSLKHARQLAVTKQRLSGERPGRVTTDTILRLVEDLGCLQLDPTAMVARNHLLVLFSRLGAFDPAMLDTLLWYERRLWEYWAHAAAIVPTRDRALHAALRPRWGAPARMGPWLEDRDPLRERVLRRIADEGPLRASDLEETPLRSRPKGWSSGGDVAEMLTVLWMSGALVSAGRDGRGRKWALAEGWFGEGEPAPRDTPAAVREAASRSLGSLGVATMRQVRGHFLRGRYPGLTEVWRQMARDGEILAVDTGLAGQWWILTADLPALGHLEAGGFEPRTVLLSPFDNLICDRARTLELFDFHFRIEIYVPRAKRWGYFVMPLLHGERLVARFDLAADRKDAALNVINERWEPGWDGRNRPAKIAARALEDLASALGLQNIRMS